MKKLILSCIIVMSPQARAAEGAFFASDLPLPDLTLQLECQNDTSPHAGFNRLKIDGKVLIVSKFSGSGPQAVFTFDLAQGSLVSEEFTSSSRDPIVVMNIQLAEPAALNSEAGEVFKKILSESARIVKQCESGLTGDGSPLPFDLKRPELTPLKNYLEDILLAQRI